jgi:putative flippase GtrA
MPCIHKATYNEANTMSELQQSNLPAILIPGFSGEATLSMASELLLKGFPVIVTCENESAMEAASARKAGCVVIESPKENALRAGLEYFHREMQGLPGIVAVYSEDGYATEDILAVIHVFSVNPNRIAIGVRATQKSLKSPTFERKAAGVAFTVVHGRFVKDAWSGLVALPAASIVDFLEEKGNGRKLLFRILLTMQRHGLKAVNAPISAPYRRRPGETRRGRLLDIGNIVWLPVKFISASLTATFADYIIRFLSFGLIFAGTADSKKTWALIVGRTTGGIVGYFLNRTLVFRKKNDSLKKELWTMAQYAALVIFNFGLSWLLVTFFMWLKLSFYIASPLADAVLYLANYTIQRDIIFRHKAPAAE